jgi:DNA-binding Lrp family transcriptional regulator
MREVLNMTRKDIDRVNILEKIISGEIKQVDAARFLKISDRQVRNLLSRLKKEGAVGVISRLVGRRGNRNKSLEFKNHVLSLLRGKYEGFGPTLAAEKLSEIEGLHISSETVRQWMIEYRLWVPRKFKRSTHIPRARRPCFGELIQADGSPDLWFGDDYPKANATVLVDDATSMITGLYFSDTETLTAYFEGLEQHLKEFGRPLALYTDHARIFDSGKVGGKTQMQEVLKRLGIELILANSPQAKGRVERANRTLQDRLKKEFRLRGIKTIDQANEYASEFVKEYNKKFSKKPMNTFDAHRSLEGYDLERLLCRKEERSLNSTAIFQYNNIHYQVQGVSEYRRLNRCKVEIRVNKKGKMRVFLKDQEIQVLPLCEVMDKRNQTMDRKEVLHWPSRSHKPAATHPWKKAG